MAQHGGQNKKPDFTDTQYEEIERMAKLGLPQKHMALIFDMSEETFESRKAKDKRLAHAILKGQKEAFGKVLQTAFDMAVSGKQPAMTIFYLKCRLRWKEPKESDPMGEDDKDLNTFTLNYKK